MRETVKGLQGGLKYLAIDYLTREHADYMLRSDPIRMKGIQKHASD
jgi:hypothetical protein